MNFKEEQKEKVEKIEAILREYLPEANGYQSVIMEAMEYSLMAGGKRLRPMLMMETYRLFGGETEVIYPFMAAMEMIHTYSLVHDDLPAMDNDEYRRGRKTTHIVYGEDMGILAGDALLNYAFETACKAFEQFPEESLRIGQAMRVLARKAGIYGMIGGQVVDVKESGHQIDEEVLDFIFRLKTGALIESAMMIGAILAGASKEDVKSMQKIAGKIGMAFQIQDDILDVTSTTEQLGKPVHSDEKNEKTTYVTLKGIEQAHKDVERMTEEAIDELIKSQQLAPEDLLVVRIGKILLERPAARAAQRQIFPFRRVIMQQRDGVQTVLHKKSVHFCRGRPPVVVIALYHQLFAGQTVEELKIRQRLGKTHCPAEIAADDAGIVLRVQQSGGQPLRQ